MAARRHRAHGQGPADRGGASWPRSRSGCPKGATEELNLVQTARLIVEGALRRKESRGGHYRSDFPRAKSTWRGRHIEL